jgi:hypothetical protein
MFQMRRSGLLTLASFLAAGTACWLPRTATAAPEKGGKVNLAQALKKTVLQFPFDVPATVPNREEVKELLTDTATSRLLASSAYTVVQFHKTLPPVARLHLDQTLSDADISEPYAEDNVKSAKIAKLVGYDLVFMGSVDDYQYNDTDKVVNMVVTGRLLDVKTGKFVTTPVTLQASSSKGGTAKEADKALEAARNAGQQLMAKVVPIANVVVEPTTPKEQPKTTPKKRKSGSDMLWGILAVGLGLGIGLASSHHGGGGSNGGGGNGGGGGGDTPPAPP